MALINGLDSFIFQSVYCPEEEQKKIKIHEYKHYLFINMR